MLSEVRVSPEPAAKVAVILVDWPTYIEVEPAEIVAVGLEGAVTVRVAGQVPVPPGPETEPP
jgi:hypothetical protein